jgi:hypothetical protein
MLLALGVGAVVIVLFLALVVSALWDSGGDEITTADDTSETDTSGGTDGGTEDDPATTAADDANGEVPDATLPATTAAGATTTVAPPPTTVAPTTTAAPPPPAPAAGAGDPAAPAPADATGANAGRSVQIAGSTRSCRFGDNCLIAGFTLVGFPGGVHEYVCEFADGSRHTFWFETQSVAYACATGRQPDSITIEVDGVRSETIHTG